MYTEDEDLVVYFDNAASTRPLKEALDLAYKISSENYANPNSIHSLGTDAEAYLTKSRRQILKYVVGEDNKSNPFECLFTSGATESNNIAIIGGAYAKGDFSKRIVTTTIEHDSVGKVFDKLEKDGFEVIRITPSKDGKIDLNEYSNILRGGVGFVSFIYCCNQNGMMLPIRELARLTKAVSPRTTFHTDMTQAIGKVEVELNDVDLASFSGHKIGAMRGCGVLLKRRNTMLVPPEVGGGQENGFRPGTSNTPGAVSLAVALKLDYQTMKQRHDNTTMLCKRLLEGLSKNDKIELMSPIGHLPHVLTFGLKYHKASVMAEYLSSHKIYVSTTSACDDRLDQPNLALRSLGYDTHCADNPIRLSFTGNETKKQVDKFINLFTKGLEELNED